MWRLILSILLILATPSAAFSQSAVQDNAEMTKLFESDQEIRHNIKPENFRNPDFVRNMISADAAWRARTHDLLASGALKTANDYYHAAFIFQHGNDADSYLIAHSLAVAATALGHEKAPWIAAATLDRYLQEIGHDQIYGTQFSRSSGEAWTMEPYDRELVPDALREALGVPKQAEQADRLDEMRAREGGA